MSDGVAVGQSTMAKQTHMVTEVVADGVWVHQSALLENNAVVVQGRDGVLLVDPGLTEDELRCLAGDLAAAGLTVAAGFATHPDWDHVLWHQALGGAPRYGTARCVEHVREVRARPGWRDRVSEGLPPEIVGQVPLDLFGLLTALPEAATHVPWDGPPVRVVEHPAHAPGHAALLVEEHGVLVAGDMLSDVLVPMLDETADPVTDYLVGLDVLDALVGEARVVVPGHGTVGDADELRARLALDRAYVIALRDGDPFDDPRTGPSAKPGWEWVADLHSGQVDTVRSNRQAEAG